MLGHGPTLSDTPNVLHVVGRLTDAVFHWLGPVCSALSAEGAVQSLLLIDDAQGRRLADGLPADVAVVFVAASANPLKHWLMLGRKLQSLVSETAWNMVYLHGLTPLLVGMPVVRGIKASGGRLLVTPHNSRWFQSLRWIGRPMLRLSNAFVPLGEFHTIANVPFDVRAMRRIARVSAQLIESPVDEIFFSVRAQVSPEPPVVVGGAASDSPMAAQRFAQLAVLLADALPKARFGWVSSVSADDCAQLEASGVEVLAHSDDPFARARLLAGASLYVAPGAGRGFAMSLAEAMAVGLPCVAYDEEPLRSMVTHQETGVLADSVEELSRQTWALLGDRSRCVLLGEQARHEATLRFSDVEFRRLLVAAVSKA